MIRFVSALLVAGFAPLAAAAGTSGTFEAGKRGHVIVPVSVNGAPAKPFVVDTAASQTVLDRSEFPQFATAPEGPHNAHARGAHGAFAAQPVQLESLAL